MISLNVIWPAIYIYQSFSEFWLIIFGTIAIELFFLRYYLKTSWKESLFIASIGNLVSGILGTIIMMFAMLLWHLVADTLFFKGTFNPVNWAATFIFMCLGSVFLETLAVKFIFKKDTKTIFLPLLIGNVLSYIFIGIILLNK